jgi:glycosyltransferase involved in cell wall biosynthesis
MGSIKFKDKKDMILAINALRSRSGGAKSHLVGILSNLEPCKYKISFIHIWGYQELLDMLPNESWLIKHCPESTNKSIAFQLIWERYYLKKEIRLNKCNFLLNTDAGTTCRFKPSTTMSRDMLSYEPGEMQRYGFSMSRIRLSILKWVQNRSLTNSTSAIFLTNYASKVIQNSCGSIKNFVIVPHGVSLNFEFKDTIYRKFPLNNDFIKCLYVSNADLYKHQWVVIKAIEILRNKGYKIKLDLIGGGEGRAQAKINRQMAISDPNGLYVKQYDYLSQKDLPLYYKRSDISIFASSCENMPNTLIEAMSSGLPIACSNRGPMPEVLLDAGIYFNPEDALSIADAIENIINNENIRFDLSKKAVNYSKKYSWPRCAHETFSHIVDVYQTIKQKI